MSDASVKLPQCAHPGLKALKYNAGKMRDDAKVMHTADFRKKYPRAILKCPRCGCDVIMYASMDHYHLGDW